MTLECSSDRQVTARQKFKINLPRVNNEEHGGLILRVSMISVRRFRTQQLVVKVGGVGARGLQ